MSTVTTTPDDILKSTAARDHLSLQVEQLGALLYAVNELSTVTPSGAKAVEVLLNLAHLVADVLPQAVDGALAETAAAAAGLKTITADCTIGGAA